MSKVKSLRTQYRGFTITVERGDSLGGWSQITYSIFRDSDGRECVSSFEESNETLRSMTTNLKRRIDAELLEDDPWGERASSWWDGDLDEYPDEESAA